MTKTFKQIQEINWSISPEKQKEVNKFLEDQPDPMKIFKRYTFDEVKEALQEFLTPEDQEGEIIKEPSEGFDGDSKSGNYSLDTNAKKSNSEQFDDLFDDKKSTVSGADDLPF